MVGRSGSGKTVTIEYLISQLFAEGYKIGAIKHIHHEGFTIDTVGKNTWRYAQAGAEIVVAISPNEEVIIKKKMRETENLEQIIDILKKDEIDIIFIEGYHGLIAKKADVFKILTAKNNVCLQEILLEIDEPIFAITGLIAKTLEPPVTKYPIIKIPEEGKVLVDLIKKQLLTSKKS
ncbi:MAG: molybdopterin-guanine dinucleotide biosynthesis protein B [Candidatus Bathyarchaeota archaeon]|nr:molybdopterin-guanine dinucleotide biosynthesis protein B [Candidatus Termiticorpusculum sp.]